MTKFAITSSVPIPRRATSLNGGGRPPKYPFALMDVGESFLVTGSWIDIERARKAACNFPKLCNINHCYKRFATRREGESVRIWRIA